MFHLVSYKWFRRTPYITSIGLFYKELGRLWRVSDCEELVGHLMEHLGLNEPNYFMYQWVGPVRSPLPP